MAYDIDPTKTRQPNSDRLKVLYDALKEDGADVGDSWQFRDWMMADENNRKTVWQAFKDDGADVGEYDEFDTWLYDLGQQPTAATQQPTQRNMGTPGYVPNRFGLPTQQQGVTPMMGATPPTPQPQQSRRQYDYRPMQGGGSVQTPAAEQPAYRPQAAPKPQQPTYQQAQQQQPIYNTQAETPATPEFRNTQKMYSDAADKAWQKAEQDTKALREANTKKIEDIYNDEHSTMLGKMAMAQTRATALPIEGMAASLKAHDMEKMANDAWGYVSDEDKEYLLDGFMREIMREAARSGGSGGTMSQEEAEKALREEAERRAKARQYQAMYDKAVAANAPKDVLDFLQRKIVEGNSLSKLAIAAARTIAGTRGDMDARAVATHDYGKGHRVADIAGSVLQIATDPVTWAAGGAGKGAVKGATAITERAAGAAATRRLAATKGGQLAQRMIGGSANFAAFEGLGNIVEQLQQGGVYNEETGQYEYSLADVAKAAGHGVLLGGATGVVGGLVGNVGDKVFDRVASTAGKLAVRGGQTLTSIAAEGTIFAAPELISGEGDFDTWLESVELMAGFKLQHGLKALPGTMGRLMRVPESRAGFETRLRDLLQGRPDLALTNDEREELERGGYTDLSELAEAYKGIEGKLVRMGDEMPYDRFSQLMADNSISEAARAKMYYYVTGRGMVQSTVTAAEIAEHRDHEGNITDYVVKSYNKDGGVITSRTYKSKKAAEVEFGRLTRQSELNSIDMLEKLYDRLPGTDATTAKMLRDVIGRESGIDIDKVIGKEENRRTDEEKAALQDYLNTMARECQDAWDRQHVDVNQQRLQPDWQEAYDMGYKADEQQRSDISIEREDNPNDPQAQAAWQGVEDRIRQDAADRADQRRAEGERMAYKGKGDMQGTIRPLTINEDSSERDPQTGDRKKKTVYLVNGTIAIEPNGNGLSREGTDKTIYVYDPETGDTHDLDPFGGAGVLEVGDVVSMEDYLAQNEQQTQAEVQQEIDNATGKVNVQPNTPFVTPEGRQGVVKSVEGDNVIVQFADGEMEQASMPLAEVQQYADALRRKEYEARHPQQTAAEQPQQPNTATEGQAPTATAETPTEGEQAAEDTRTPAQRTYDDVVAKLGADRASKKIDATAKVKADRLTKAQKALKTAQETADNTEYGSKEEQKAEEAVVKAQAEYDAAQQDMAAWDEVRKLRDQALLAQAEQEEQQRKAELERKRAEETEAQRKQREEYEAEQARRKAEAEAAEKRRQEENERLKQQAANPQPAEQPAPIEGTKGQASQLAIARQELAGDPEALAMLDETTPRTLVEVAATLLASGKNATKLLKEDFKRETGYSDADVKRYPFLFAGADKGGITLARFGEMVVEAAREYGVQFDENDATAGIGAALELLGSVSSQADINNYITNSRIAEAYDYHNAALAAARARMLEAYGMTESEYEAYMSWLEDAIEQGKSTLSDEEFNQLFNVYEQGQTTDVARGNQEGTETTERPESAETDVSQDGERGNGEADAGAAEVNTAYAPTEEEYAEIKAYLDEHPTASRAELQRALRLGYNKAEIGKQRWESERVTAQGATPAEQPKSGRTRRTFKKGEKKSVEQLFEEEKAKYVGKESEGNEYAEVLAMSKTVADAVSEFNRRADAALKEADDWRNRTYKPNNAIVEGQNGADEYTTTIGAANERRRENNIKRLEDRARELQGYAETLKERTGYTPAAEQTEGTAEGEKRDYNKPLKSLAEVKRFMEEIGYNGSMSATMTTKDGRKFVKYRASGNVSPNIYFGETTPRDILQQFYLYNNIMEVYIPADILAEFEQEDADRKESKDNYWANEREKAKDILTQANIPFVDVIDSERGIRLVFTERTNERGNYIDWMDLTDIEQLQEDIEGVRNRAKTIISARIHEEEKTIAECHKGLESNEPQEVQKHAYYRDEITFAEQRLAEYKGQLEKLTTPKQEPKAEKAESTEPKEPKRLISDKQMDELKERLRKKLRGQLNSGIDPETLSIGLQLAVGHIERGLTKFADFAKRMIEDLGDAIRPYLKSFYNGARDFPGAEKLAEQMTPYDEVRAFDVENFDKARPSSIVDTAKEIAAEQEIEKEVEKIKKPTKGNKKEDSTLSDTEQGQLDLFGSPSDTETETPSESNLKFTEEQRAKVSETVMWDMSRGLTNGEKPYKSVADIRKMAQDAGLDVDAEGRDDVALQEMVEDGLVRAARKVIESKRHGGSKSRTAYEAICELYDLQPTISRRSDNRVKMQQYSTPLPMAFVADMFAYRPNGRTLEPTAGNGMLVFAIPAKNVVVNELDETRLANLRQQGFEIVLNEDATSAAFTPKAYDSVIANPPFGKAEEKMYDGKSIAGLDEQIALNALAAMKDNGRAAIIIGGNMEYGNNGAIKGNKAFWTYLYDHYNVKGVVDMAGKLYAKQGTTYPTRMILIDGRRSEEERAQSTIYPPRKHEAIRKAETFNDLYDIVTEVLNSNNKTNGNEVLRTSSSPVTADTDNAAGKPNAVSNGEQPNANADNGQNAGTRPTDSRGSGESNKPTEQRPTQTTARPSNGGTELTGNAGVSKPQGNNGGNAVRGGERGGSGRAGDTERVQHDGVRGNGNAASGVRLTEQRETEKRTLTEEKLSYRPHNSAFSLQSVAPAAMVEAMDKSLAEIENTWGNIDEFVTNELGYDSVEEMHNALAAEQVDSVAMAIFQMQQGKAMIIGDQTGVGKGRQMAALIRWACRHGKKPIFITQKDDLFTDLYRDLVDVGSGDLRPFIFNAATESKDKETGKKKYLGGVMLDADGNLVYKALGSAAQAKIFASGKLPDEYDFVVLTYSQVNTGDMISSEAGKGYAKESGNRSKKTNAEKNKKPTPKATFLRDIAQSNYLFLDESHTAAGDSNVGAFIRSIIGTYAGSQAGYAQGVNTGGVAGVTFASATFAKRPDTMPMYAMRTAMSEANVQPYELISIIARGGVTLQEIMSRALTESGQMVRRERDMSDVRTDWETIDNPELVQRARENYDKTIVAFNAIIKFQEDYVKPMIDALDAQLSLTASSADVKKGTNKMGVENVPFASKTYNYTKQLMLALKVDAIVDRVEQEIKAGRHPVIALESTMEASIKDYNAGDVIGEPTFSASLLRGLDNCMQYTVKDEDGKESHFRYDPRDLGPDGERAYYELQDFIRQSTSGVFISPLDAIIEKLHERGYKVGELTGRNSYVERDADGNVVVKKRTDKDKKRMQRDFNSGALDVLILNKSASTGISLHASEKFSDQRQRSMIIAQPLSDINDYMQMIGRIDRTGQVHRGYYINLGLPVPAESRFLMMLSTKLKSLNANTTTSQESESSNVEAPDLLNKYGSQVIVEYLRDNPDIYVKMGEPLKKSMGQKLKANELDNYEAPKNDEVARKITGYVALLNTKEQEDFYNDVVRRYTDLIKYLDSTGTNDLKITVMPLKAKTLSKSVSSEGKDPNGSNPFAQNAYVEEVEMDVLRKPMKADEIRKSIEQLNTLQGTEKGNVGTAAQDKAAGERALEIAGVVEREEAAKLAAEEERHAAALQSAEAAIAKRREKLSGQQNISEEEKAEKLAEYTAETMQKVNERHEANMNKIRSTTYFMKEGLRRYSVGNTYILPQEGGEDGNASLFTSPAIFCGYKVKESKLTPSTSFAVFATLDGRRRIEVKFTDNQTNSQIGFLTSSNYAQTQQVTLDNWDSHVPTNTRKKGYIMTGNILQAVSDTQDEATGAYVGQLISYTDEEGNIHDGVLMPDRWQPAMLKTSGVPILARLAQLLRGGSVTSTDGKVIITTNRYGDGELSVPKTKKEGEKYFTNETILSAISGGFWEKRGKFNADIVGEDNIRTVVTELSNMGVRVKADPSTDSDVRFRGEEEPVFYSNAMRAVENIKQERATPEQWVKMIEKQGGLKAGEDKWLGLSEWLKGMSDRKDREDRNDRVLTLTKQEVLDYIRANEIQVEEVEYADAANNIAFEALKQNYDTMLRDSGYDYAWEQMREQFGDDAEIAFTDVGGELEIANAEAAAALLGSETPINETRLQYTTEGLDNKREIVLTVPTIEPWNEHDEVHFGEAGGGRAVAWVRFGETTIPNEEWEKKKIAEIRESDAALEDFEKRMEEKYGTSRYQLSFRRSLSDEEKKTYSDLQNKGKQLFEEYRNRPGLRVLVIDEIQSNRHQEGREKGYREIRPHSRQEANLRKAVNDAQDRYDEYTRKMGEKYGGAYVDIYADMSEEDRKEADRLENAVYEADAAMEKHYSAIPDAPFEKNWHEVAMKRMLRFAAENGYDKVAWTKGEQQAERYDLSNTVDKVDVSNVDANGEREITIITNQADIFLDIDSNGKVIGQQDTFSQNLRGKNLSEVLGREMANSILKGEHDGETISGDGLKFGGEGMKGFYDQILPRFMDKYGKKWGVKTGEVELPNLGDRNDRENRGDRGLTMWSVDVTDDMRESVMRGQPLFRPKTQSREGGEEAAKGDWYDRGSVERIGAFAGYTPKRIAAMNARQEESARRQFREAAEKLHLGDRITFVESIDEIEGIGEEQRKAWRRKKGWYSPRTGKIVIILGNHKSMDDVMKSILHEGVAHHGLRQMFGKHFNTFLDNVYQAASPEIRERIYAMAKKHGWDFRTATEEYLATLAEDTEFEKPENQSWWKQVKAWFIDLLHKIGFNLHDAYDTITDNELRYILWRSYENLVNPGRYNSVVEEAKDIAKQYDLKVGQWDETWSVAAEAEPNATMEYNGRKIPVWAGNGRRGNRADRVEREDRMGSDYNVAADGVAEDGVRFRDGEDEESDSEERESIEQLANNMSIGTAARFAAIAARNAKESHDNAEALAAALNFTSQNLAEIVKATKAQKKFDKATVKQVTDMARVMVSADYLDSMGRADVKGLLKAIRESTGETDNTDKVNRIIDIMVKNQLKNQENTLATLLKIKGSRVDARGINVQGKLDPNGQQTIKAFKDNLKEQRETIESRIADAEERMTSEDRAIADAAYNEKVGLQLALDYVEKIGQSKADEKDIEAKKRAELSKVYDYTRVVDVDEQGNALFKKDGTERTHEVRHVRAEYKGKISDEKKAERERVEQTAAAMDDAIRHMRMERIDAYTDFIAQVAGNMKESMRKLEERREAEKRRIEEIHHNANSDMEGRPASEHRSDTGGVLNWINNTAGGTLFAPLASFGEMLRMFGRKSPNGEGYLFNRFMRGLIDARHKELNGVHDKYSELDRKAQAVFGGKVETWADMMNEVRKGENIAVEWFDGKEMKPHTLHQGNLMYIYMVNKMSDGRMKLRHMGIDAKAMAVIESKLDPRLKEIADWLQDDFLVRSRNEYNETHKRMFGASMSAIEDYFPLVINSGSRNKDAEKEDAAENNPNTITTATGAIKKRTVNVVDLDLLNADAMHVILDHIAEMEHWNAFAEYNRDLNTLRSYKRFENQVKNMTTILGDGEQTWKAFNKTAQIAVGSYQKAQSDLDAKSLEFASKVTAAKVAFRINTALKQLLSLPAYLPYANASGFYHALANDLGNGTAPWKWCMENLPMYRERWESRVSGDPRLLKLTNDWKSQRATRLQKISRAGMLPNAAVDALTVSIGAHAVYETRKAQYLKEGYSETAAEKRAIQDAEIAYNETQQSSEGGFVSVMQVDKSWLNVLFTIFRNASMAYQRQLHGALRNLINMRTKARREQAKEFLAKQIARDGVNEAQARLAAEQRFNRAMRKNWIAVATFGYIVQFAWNFGGQMWYLLFGDDDDKKKKTWKDILIHSLFGGVEGLTGGDWLSELGRQIATGDRNPQSLNKDMPLTSDMFNIIEKFGQDREWEAVSDIVNLAVQAGVGANPQTLTDIVVATIDACNGDLGLAREAGLWAMRVIQVPQSQTEQIYFDEIEMTGEEARKLSYEQLVERYAKYRVKRNYFWTPWEWDNEKAIEKGEKRGERIVKERMETMSDEQLEEALSNLFESSGEKGKKLSFNQYAKQKGLKGYDYSDVTKNDGAKYYMNIATWRDIAEDITLHQETKRLEDEIKRLKKLGVRENEAVYWQTDDKLKDLNEVKKEIGEMKKEMVDANGNPMSEEIINSRMEDIRNKRRNALYPEQAANPTDNVEE